jgi:dTDP-4-dehydrorhamnose 3,5-epimerase
LSVRPHTKRPVQANEFRVEPLENIPDVLLVTPELHRDGRGSFFETWREDRYAAAGIGPSFAQDNHARSNARGIVRGLHCQIGENTQGKLVRVVQGRIWDVAVDIRPDSPTRGKHAFAVLSASNRQQLWIPPGFLHGYCTLTRETVVIYKVTRPYDPKAEKGVVWNDPALNVPWPVAEANAILSRKDKALFAYEECHSWF